MPYEVDISTWWRLYQDQSALYHAFDIGSIMNIICTITHWYLLPRQNGCHFADNIFKCIFFNENMWILIKISQKIVPKGPISNIPALIQITAWRQPGDKPLSEPMMVRHICATRPQWVNRVTWQPLLGLLSWYLLLGHVVKSLIHLEIGNPYICPIFNGVSQTWLHNLSRVVSPSNGPQATCPTEFTHLLLYNFSPPFLIIFPCLFLNLFLITSSPFPITSCPFPITSCPFPITSCPFLITSCSFPITSCPFDFSSLPTYPCSPQVLMPATMKAALSCSTTCCLASLSCGVRSWRGRCTVGLLWGELPSNL